MEINMKDIMIDLETLGLESNCVILSIGAVMFDIIDDPHGADMIPLFYRNISKQSCLDIGMEINKATENWWLEQSIEAQKALETEQIPLRQALMELSEFVRNAGVSVRVWSNGAAFDIAMLNFAYRRCDLALPWSFRNERDLRTIMWMTRRKYKPEIDEFYLSFKGTKHNALDDAQMQARQVQKCWHLLNRFGWHTVNGLLRRKEN
jgi:inhibitor of KinA sporulation pathway (predicted exonuclease)